MFRLDDEMAAVVLAFVAVFYFDEWASRVTGNDFLMGPAFPNRRQADQWGCAEVDRAQDEHLPRSAVIYLRAEYMLDKDA